ncbi:MAG: oxidoreductase [Rhodobacteraceae bacterium]|nr:MAG: oxidoreductase [Paracoccaceae bacterium]
MESIIKSIVVTGASSGIGLSICKLFLKRGYVVFGTVRKKNQSSNLKKLLGDNFFPLVLDVRDKKAISESVLTVKKHLGHNSLTALINNAGIAILGPIEFLDPAVFQRQIETNLIGTLNCTQAFLPLLKAKKNTTRPTNGRIINISSALGGKIGYPFYGAYCSSKHAIEGFSEALRRELTIHKVFVSIIAPGAIQTPIWDKAENDILINKYEGTVYESAYKKMVSDMKKLGANGLQPETVAKKVIQAVETQKPKLRYTFINELSLNLLYFAPRRLLDRLITKYLGLTGKKIEKYFD